MKTFERLLPGEDAYITEIVAGILHAQIRTAVAQHRPLMRGTHTKGVCVRGTFEVYDLTQKIKDPILRDRLAHGVFAKPGTYPATVRFANADVKIAPDYVPDVRAVSFAVSLPPGVLGPDAVRHDFSLNSATTFPINDSHSFAIFVRLLEADGIWGKIKAFTTLSPAEIWGFLLIGIRAAPQKWKTARRLYQRLRYWSNTPFRHGPDEAVKYTAIALAKNPGRTPPKDENMLRDELLRHVEVDPRLSEFEFGIQLLDSDKMRRWFRKHDDIYWVENASYEWPEDDAPFHTVGRLTLAHDGQLTPEECEKFYIDVTENSTAESHPLGSLNRARWFAESASRHARLGTADPRTAVDPHSLPPSRDGAPLPAPAAPGGTWLGGVTLRSVAKAAVILSITLSAFGAAFALVATIYVNAGWGSLPIEHLASVDYPDRGFGAGVDAPKRQAFYYTPQGAGLEGLHYKWFINFEMPWGKTKLIDPSVITRYGFLVDPPTERNPDRLPVGFTKHFDPTVNAELLDVTCAACHTGEINVTRNGQTRALRIDGGQANHAFTDASKGHFLPTLMASLASTTMNPFKFVRFAHAVLGPTYPEGRFTLWKQLFAENWTFVRIAWNESKPWPLHSLAPVEEGYGRTDALARIGNTVFGENLTPKNFKVGNAPVNFPSLWNIWKFDWVQYNASVSQPMARNMGEAMGVGATYALVNSYGAPLPFSERFRSSARIESLDSIEHTLRDLQPPAWQQDILGKVNVRLADTGLKLFNTHCVGCHGPHIASAEQRAWIAPGKADSQPVWLVATLCANDIGTDSNAAHNFFVNTVDITKTGMTAIELRRVARRSLEQMAVRKSAPLVIDSLNLAKQSDTASVRQLAADRAKLKIIRDSVEQVVAQIDPTKLPLGAALSYLGTMIREKAYADAHYTPERQAELDGFGAIDLPQVIDAYKSKPLAGIWATPPFLHNGSVPTIYQLLSPVKERDVKFKVGSREYDTRHLGLEKVEGFWTYDTRISGNRNTGHEFSADYKSGPGQEHNQKPGVIGPLLTPFERKAIIEHLKVRDDDRDGPKTPANFPNCRS